jgi:branched-chain amino acid transport system permease protein
VLGGFLYTYADARLVELSGTSAFAGLPDGLRAVLSQPLFILGLLFILVVYFAPAGLTGLASRRRLFIRRKETP